MALRPGLLLDVSRLVSRIGLGALTGIDRVEAAWLRHVADRDHLLLCRVTRGQILLPPAAGPVILRFLDGDLAGLSDKVAWRDRIRGRGDPPSRARATLAAMAIARSGASGRGLRRSYLRHLPGGSAYLNLGHSNLSPVLLSRLTGLTRAVMIHDTIPLDFPQYTRRGRDQAFRTRFAAAMEHADQILAVSETTAADVRRWRDRLCIRPKAPIQPIPIGTTLAPPVEDDIPAGLDLSRPFFVTIGTIEPRKNHMLLLDAWEELAQRLPPERLPRLFIIGRRGWENRALFARLDALPADAPITELSGLSDGAVAALLLRSHGLLMPSHAEGFGLPLTEAAGRGVPVIATPIPAARELLGDYARYLPADRPLDWAGAVALLAAELPLRMKPLAIPGWERHFERVDKALSEASPRLSTV